jgi:hypothetical protein
VIERRLEGCGCCIGNRVLNVRLEVARNHMSEMNEDEQGRWPDIIHSGHICALT